MILYIIHLYLLSWHEVGEVELFYNRRRGIEPLDDQSVFSLGHFSYKIGRAHV